MTARILAVVDRDARGTPTQLADLLDFCVGLRSSFGSLDLVLRGSAVACASAAQPDGGDLSESVRRLRTLIKIGVQVWADEVDLVSFGRPAATVMDGVITADTDTLAVRWPEYEDVWFL